MPQLDDRSHHARDRMQQRGVSEAALDLLLRYGRTSHVQGGCYRVYMDGRARRNAIRECGRAAGPVIDRICGLFAVVGGNGVVVTVCHRRRRTPRD